MKTSRPNMSFADHESRQDFHMFECGCALVSQGFSIPAAFRLSRDEISSARELSSMTAKEILKIDGVGHVMLGEILDVLAKHGLTIKDWDPIPHEHEHHLMRKLKEKRQR